MAVVLLAGCAGSRGGEGGNSGYALTRWFDRTPTRNGSRPFPSAGEDFTMIYDPTKDRIVVFGGKDDDDHANNEVWSLDRTKNAWRKIKVEGVRPPPTEDHTAIFDPIGYRMVVHGGEDGRTTNNLWSLDLKTNRWRNMTGPTTPRREDHTAIFDDRGKRMVIFGGRIDNSTVNIYELLALDLDPQSPTFEQWQNLTVEENHPPGRGDHAAVYDATRNRMVIFGGWDKRRKTFFDDTWAFYFGDASRGRVGRWDNIKGKKRAPHPRKRRHVAGVYDSTRDWFIIFGGYGEEGHLNDAWAFDLVRDVWLDVTPGPGPRFDHGAVYDSKREHLIVYGGDGVLRGMLHDVWDLELEPESHAGERNGSKSWRRRD
jgi:hypothetical protein